VSTNLAGSLIQVLKYSFYSKALIRSLTIYYKPNIAKWLKLKIAKKNDQFFNYLCDFDKNDGSQRKFCVSLK